MPWFYLVLAGACEMAWPFGFKYTAGFTRHWWAMILTAALLAISFGLMTLASKTLPVGTVYAVWTGMGAAGIALIGMFLLNEPRDFGRIVCLSLIVAGVIGLKFWTTDGKPQPVVAAGPVAVVAPAAR